MSEAAAALISVEELAAQRESILLLDATIRRGGAGEPPFASGRAEFERAHIPGARHADLLGPFSDTTTDLPFMRPSIEQMTAAARTVGIVDGIDVVVYDGLTGAWAARIWWLLRSFGVTAVRVLDGGLDAWLAAGLPVATGVSPVVAGVGPLTLVDHPDDVAGIEEVAAVAAGPDAARLVCGLRRTEYDGDPADESSGHIPGSVNLPFAETLDVDGRISVGKVRRLVDELNLDRMPGSPILYCGGAINAAGVALALHEVGITDVQLFDGSLAQWRQDRRRLTRTPRGEQ